MLGDKASDFTSKSPDHIGIKPIHASNPLFDPLSASVLVVEVEEVSDPSLQTLSSDIIVDFGLTKSQKWLLASLREAIQDDVIHLVLLKDMEESWCQGRKEVHELLSTEEEDWNLASLKDELEWFIGGRNCPQTRSKGKREYQRVVS
jgi:hypothetical protein